MMEKALRELIREAQSYFVANEGILLDTHDMVFKKAIDAAESALEHSGWRKAEEITESGWYWKRYPNFNGFSSYVFYAYKDLGQLWEKESGLPVAGGSGLYYGPLSLPEVPNE
jgi:hypothetical protein